MKRFIYRLVSGCRLFGAFVTGIARSVGSSTSSTCWFSFWSYHWPLWRGLTLESLERSGALHSPAPPWWSNKFSNRCKQRFISAWFCVSKSYLFSRTSIKGNQLWYCLIISLRYLAPFTEARWLIYCVYTHLHIYIPCMLLTNAVTPLWRIPLASHPHLLLRPITSSSNVSSIKERANLISIKAITLWWFLN